MQRVRLNAQARREIIRSAGVELVRREGVSGLTFEKVAAECDVETSVGTVRRYYHTFEDLVTAVAGQEGCPQDAREKFKRMGYCK